jgi:uncharacterized protein
MKKIKLRVMVRIVLLFVLAGAIAYRFYFNPRVSIARFVKAWYAEYKPEIVPGAAVQGEGFYGELAEAAVKCTASKVVYDPSYFKIPYPGGDVPAGKGVCTDVVIRVYRLQGIDLQKEVHEDMQENFGKYPHIWLLAKTDTNIDHRRVPNLMVFFRRKGLSLPLSNDVKDYSPGDIVCWELSKGTTHIGLVSNRKARSGRFMVVHNIGGGQVLEDVLFDWKIIGHFRYGNQ